MSLTRFLIPLVLPATVLLEGCAGPGATTGTADCRGLGGGYRDAGEPNGDSLTQFLLRKKSPESRLVQLDVGAESIRASSGTVAGTLAVEQGFNCSAASRIVFTLQESLRIHLLPLFDQVKTVTYVVTGGPGMDLAFTRLGVIFASLGGRDGGRGGGCCARCGPIKGRCRLSRRSQEASTAMLNRALRLTPTDSARWRASASRA